MAIAGRPDDGKKLSYMMVVLVNRWITASVGCVYSKLSLVDGKSTRSTGPLLLILTTFGGSSVQWPTFEMGSLGSKKRQPIPLQELLTMI